MSRVKKHIDVKKYILCVNMFWICSLREVPMRVVLPVLPENCTSVDCEWNAEVCKITYGIVWKYVLRYVHEPALRVATFDCPYS